MEKLFQKVRVRKARGLRADASPPLQKLCVVPAAQAEQARQATSSRKPAFHEPARTAFQHCIPRMALPANGLCQPHLNAIVKIITAIHALAPGKTWVSVREARIRSMATAGVWFFVTCPSWCGHTAAAHQPLRQARLKPLSIAANEPMNYCGVNQSYYTQTHCFPTLANTCVGGSTKLKIISFNIKLSISLVRLVCTIGACALDLTGQTVKSIQGENPNVS